MKNLKKYLRLYLTGFSMGVADLIPGVSGGTIAFISGIYEELLYSIKVVSGKFLKEILSARFKSAFVVIPFGFLVPLVAGILSAIFTLAHTLSYLLQNQPIFVWAFFFGLVLASTLIVLRRVVKWDLVDKVAFVVSAILAYILVGGTPVATPATLPLFFVSGMVAICAMILPGISGSFILVLLGKYEQVLGAVINREILIIAVFVAGAALGLSLFARVLTWLFREHHDISIVILAGFMLGSTRKIWPWKETIFTDPVTQEIIQQNIIPSSFDSSFLTALVLMIVGAIMIFYLQYMQVTREHIADIKNKTFKKEHKKSLASQKKRI